MRAGWGTNLVGMGLGAVVRGLGLAVGMGGKVGRAVVTVTGVTEREGGDWDREEGKRDWGLYLNGAPPRLHSCRIDLCWFVHDMGV